MFLLCLLFWTFLISFSFIFILGVVCWFIVSFTFVNHRVRIVGAKYISFVQRRFVRSSFTYTTFKWWFTSMATCTLLWCITIYFFQQSDCIILYWDSIRVNSPFWIIILCSLEELDCFLDIHSSISAVIKFSYASIQFGNPFLHSALFVPFFP